jgi:hypothetical protein
MRGLQRCGEARAHAWAQVLRTRVQVGRGIGEEFMGGHSGMAGRQQRAS